MIFTGKGVEVAVDTEDVFYVEAAGIVDAIDAAEAAEAVGAVVGLP